MENRSHGDSELNQQIGAESGDIVIFEELMDANWLFLTANADTVYYVAWIDL